jgi:uncharacterized protein with HEPN domain
MRQGPEADKIYVAHMLECIDRVLAYTESGQEVFMQSSMVQDAVIRNLQTMAESSQRLSEPTKSLSPHTPWRAISGFRNIIVHDYLGLDLDVVWSVVEKELPALQSTLRQLQSVI